MSLKSVSELPQEGFVRAGTLAKVLGIAVVTVWRWSAKGILPQPVKLSERVTAWRAEDKGAACSAYVTGNIHAWPDAIRRMMLQRFRPLAP